MFFYLLVRPRVNVIEAHSLSSSSSSSSPSSHLLNLLRLCRFVRLVVDLASPRYYDYKAGANLILITPDANISDVLWDLELNDRVSSDRECSWV